jgi:hypothetical protein
VEQPEPNEPVLMGIMAEILSEELNKEGNHAPFLELPVKEPAESIKRKIFRKELIQNMEPCGKEV